MRNVKLRSVDLIAQQLQKAGCRHAFGIPGGEVLTLVDALESAGIKFYLTKHENAAGFMAEGVHHINKAPGILVATLGPGAMNGVNVVANAFQDKVPLIVLTGCVDTDDTHTYTHQVMDHGAVFSSITKNSFRLIPESADIIIEKAISLALDARQGPVHIDIPIGVAKTLVGSSGYHQQAPTTRTAPVGADIERAKSWLGQSSCPVALIGLDVLRDQSNAILEDFVNKFQIPFITTYKAKGVINENHPLCLGGAGLSPLADSYLIPFVRQADLVICIGYDPIEMRAGWRHIWDIETQNVIDISAVANTHYMHTSNLNFVADTSATILALMQESSRRKRWSGGELPQLRSDLARSFPHDDDWGPAAVISEARIVLPMETIATVDSGAHRILLSQMWCCHEPRGLVQSTALCTMGCAVPQAIGLKLAAPERPVVAFSGDAGFLMVVGELSTCSELGLPVIFVVFVDSSLGLIELKQRQRQLPNCGVNFECHDYAALGRALGGVGTWVTTRSELRHALQLALQADTFSVIAADIGRGGYDGRI